MYKGETISVADPHARFTFNSALHADETIQRRGLLQSLNLVEILNVRLVVSAWHVWGVRFSLFVGY